MKQHKVQGRLYGLFSNLNQVIDAFWWGEQKDVQVLVDWRTMLPNYKVNLDDDVWDIMCERVGYTAEEAHQDLPNVNPARCFAADNVITPRFHTKHKLLLPPKNRHAAKAIINRHVHFKPVVQLRTDLIKFNVEKTIGVHLRGPWRYRDKTLRRIVSMLNVPNPPFQLFFNKIDELLSLGMENIFLGTDATVVKNGVKKRYGKRVISQDCFLTRNGELHHRPDALNHATGDEMLFDALADALAFSKTAFFLHGNSNLSNFVLGYSPFLPSYDVFGSWYAKAVNNAYKV